MNSNTLNILCISIDSFRQDYCPIISGTDEDIMPSLSDFAKSATSYSRAISPSCWTLQVHGSVFTGLYPPEHQVLDKGDSLGTHPTLAELLADEGYDVRSFGHNGWLETGGVLRGFEHSSTAPVFRSKQQAIYQLCKQTVRGDPFASWTVERDEQTVSNVTETMGEAESPFCYFVHFNGAHWPYAPRASHYKKFTDRSLFGVNKNILSQRKLYKNNRPGVYANEWKPSEGVVNTAKQLYRGCLHEIDSFLSTIISQLKEQKILDNTIVIIFGDHGDNFGEDGLYGHHFSVADSLIRVPLIISDPTGVLPEGNQQQVVQLNDIYPTVLSLCDVGHPEPINSVDLSTDSRDSAFTYYSAPQSFIDKVSKKVDPGSLPPRRQYVVWRSPDEKLIYYPDEDRYAGPAEGSRELRRAMRTHRDNFVTVQEGTADAEISRNVENNLKKMGYL